MAREIILNLGNEQSIFEFDKIDRKDLYGYKKRFYFDQNNDVCKKGLLDLENGSLLKSGYLSSCYVNDEKNLINKDELSAENINDEKIETKPSTLGTAQQLNDASAKDVLNTKIQSVYFLSPKEIGKELEKNISEGKIFHFSFNYFKDFHLEDAYLIKNEFGIFALIGDHTEASWSESKKIMITEINEVEDDLDFEMM